MARLSFGYSSLFPGGLLRPMVDAVAINLLNGFEADFTGILDTGADYISLEWTFLEKLGIDPRDLKRDDIETPSGGASMERCNFIEIAIEHEGRRYHLNGEGPTPVLFTPPDTSCLLGQNSFLRNCIATFNGPGRVVTLDF